jgi:uncharacterized protein (TIGR03086 family)
MDAVEAIELSQAEFERRLREVAEDQWAWPTPCDQWSVRDLANHVVVGSRMYVALLDGCSSQEAAAILHGYALGDDPVDDFVRAAALVPDAFRRPGVLERTYPHPSRDVLGAELAWWRAEGNTIHSWDLARAIGTDERLNEDLVDAVWAQLEPVTEVLAQSGAFGQGSSGAVESTEPTQRRLLDICGRRP